MKFNVLIVAAMVITSVNAGRRKRLPSCLGGRYTSKSRVSLELTENNWGTSQESDPNETGPTCDDLEVKLRDFYDKISARNFITRYNTPDLYRIMEGNMGSRVENGKDGAETEVAQKSDGNEVQESIYTRVEDWLKLHPKYRPRLEQLRQELAKLLEQHLEVWEQFLRKDCLTTKDRRFSPETLFDDLLLVRWYYKTAQAQDTDESDVDMSDKQ
ncbi:hypothetical protein BASA83_005105 [Batrachochytrium salamandrivorans]|nr:hypothetical protein BASA83_005105 [Batrachochytrium salamandrivorans]